MDAAGGRAAGGAAREARRGAADQGQHRVCVCLCLCLCLCVRCLSGEGLITDDAVAWRGVLRGYAAAAAATGLAPTGAATRTKAYTTRAPAAVHD